MPRGGLIFLRIKQAQAHWALHMNVFFFNAMFVEYTHQEQVEIGVGRVLVIC
jgi:hypothetical protein